MSKVIIFDGAGFEGYPSIRSLIQGGDTILTF